MPEFYSYVVSLLLKALVDPFDPYHLLIFLLSSYFVVFHELL